MTIAAEKKQSLKISYGLGQVYETYLDQTITKGFPYDYISATYQTYQIHSRLSGYFKNDLNFSLALADINSAQVVNVSQVVEIPARFSTFFHASFIKKFDSLHLLYGTTSMLTFAKQNRNRLVNSQIEQIDQGNSLDTNFSFAFFAFGLYFFEQEKLGFRISFLDHNSNFIQGWFTTAVWYRLEGQSKIYLGTEVLSRENFGHGINSFMRSSASVFLRYDQELGNLITMAKLGMVLNPPRVDRSGIISFFDRFYGEIGLTFLF